MKIIDLSLLIENGMPTCGTKWHQNVEIVQMGKIEEVGRNTHSILVGSHTGTHMDAPYHFIQNGSTIDTIDLSIACGEVSIVDFRKVKSSVITVKDVKKLNITDRMLFVFGWYKTWKTDKFYKDYPYFSYDAIMYLIEKGMKLMAMDTPSPDRGNAIMELDNSPNHKLLLESNIIIVEYLCNTEQIDMNKKYEIFALPMKIEGSDGAPARVILREAV